MAKRTSAATAGVLFALSCCATPAINTRLAQELLEEGDPNAARAEARRALASDPHDHVARLVETTAQLRIDQLATGSDNKLTRRQSLASMPATLIVAIYRRFVAPAIGWRCSLTPSCSAYFLQAAQQHGLMAFPMAADRLVREPSVVADASNPILLDGQLRFPDPVSDHDQWLRDGGK